MDTWHYHAEICTLEDLLHPDRLNDLGDLGWELIAIERIKDTQPKQSKWLVVFKKLFTDGKA